MRDTTVQPDHATAASTISATPAPGYAGDITPQEAYRHFAAGALLVDIRSTAELAWVGRIPGAHHVPWKEWPAMQENPQFDALLLRIAQPGDTVLLICRSGVRSIPASQRATQLGLRAYNVLEGFEGDLNPGQQRNQHNGWRVHGLPWVQG